MIAKTLYYLSIGCMMGCQPVIQIDNNPNVSYYDNPDNISLSAIISGIFDVTSGCPSLIVDDDGTRLLLLFPKGTVVIENSDKSWSLGQKYASPNSLISVTGGIVSISLNQDGITFPEDPACFTQKAIKVNS